MIKHPFKLISNKDSFYNKILVASKILHDPVAATLGPNGLPILLKQYDGNPPKITKDGVTVANSIFVKDPLLDTIIQAIKEASRKTNTEAGDGTTTAIVLAHALMVEAMKFINTGAILPQQLRKVMSVIEQDLLDNERGQINQYAQPIQSKDDMINVAMISSNADREIADSVVEAVNMAGDHGFITLEEGFQHDILVKHYDGFRLDVGFQKLGPIGPSLITHPEKQTIEVSQPAIVIYDGDILHGEVAAFTNALTEMGNNKIPVVVIAYSFDANCMQAVMIGKRMGFNILLVKCPVYGSADTRRLILDDFAVWTGAKPIDVNPNSIMSIVGQGGVVDKSYLGSCDRIVMSQNHTIAYGGKGSTTKILERVHAIKANKDNAESQYMTDIFDIRLAMMTGGVVHIFVGATTEFEMKERKDRVEDALAAVRASTAEGIVAGGGTIFLKLARDLNSLNYGDPLFKIAATILNKAFEVPLRLLAKNTGVSPDLIVDQVQSMWIGGINAGWDARNNTFCADMIQHGIIDPLKVVRSAIRNAISISMSLLCGGGAVVFGEDKIAEKQDIEGFYINEGENQ